jgi:hypothetical protein
MLGYSNALCKLHLFIHKTVLALLNTTILSGLSHYNQQPSIRIGYTA